MVAAFFILAFLGLSASNDDLLSGADVDLMSDAAEAQFAVYLSDVLPDTVEVIGFYEGGFQDRFIQVRFEMSPEYFEGFLWSLGIENAEFETATGLIGIADPDWWIPETLQNPLVGSPSFSYFPYSTMVIGFDPDRPDYWQVYLVAMET